MCCGRKKINDEKQLFDICRPLSGSYAGSDCLQRRRCAGKTRTFADCRSRIAGISRTERGIGIVRLEKRDFEKPANHIGSRGVSGQRARSEHCFRDRRRKSADGYGTCRRQDGGRGFRQGRILRIAENKRLQFGRRYARHRTYRFDVEDGRTGHHDVPNHGRQSGLSCELLGSRNSHGRNRRRRRDGHGDGSERGRSDDYRHGFPQSDGCRNRVQYGNDKSVYG